MNKKRHWLIRALLFIEYLVGIKIRITIHKEWYYDTVAKD